MNGQSQTGILQRAYENGQYNENHPNIPKTILLSAYMH